MSAFPEGSRLPATPPDAHEFPGVMADLSNINLVEGLIPEVERVDEDAVYEGDLEAAFALAKHLSATRGEAWEVRFAAEQDRPAGAEGDDWYGIDENYRIYDGTLADGVWIAEGSDPWIIRAPQHNLYKDAGVWRVLEETRPLSWITMASYATEAEGRAFLDGLAYISARAARVLRLKGTLATRDHCRSCGDPIDLIDGEWLNSDGAGCAGRGEPGEVLPHRPRMTEIALDTFRLEMTP